MSESESKICYINTNFAAYILGVCTQRMRQLLTQNRVEGALKVDGFWKIPLYEDKLKIKRAPKRNRKGSWDTNEWQRAKAAMIHVWSQRIQTNRNKKKGSYLDPPIIVRQAKEVKHGHMVEIKGECKVVYNAYKSRHGAAVWIETKAGVEVEITVFDEAMFAMETS